ncbi:DUF2255 family protein [Nonomuraea spiralis]|uniref:DUF2255 family protein n=1 Tax=Nonomuraea spiralis TaxID=46182 RepID=A0ABV5IX04_9ACTN|nr:DUF2255 family protein [Nonomuraea spiralis]GGT22056.1 hypothetical protein GCM10010176_078220 [Nonomuraea spiralis]
MTAWTNDELDRIAGADELQIASLRGDGDLRRAVTIWVVRLGDDLYVRAVNGRDGTWFRGAQERGRGRVQAGGVDKGVTFADADPELNDRIDAEYRAKYRHYAESIVETVVSQKARAATIRLVPRS